MAPRRTLAALAALGAVGMAGTGSAVGADTDLAAFWHLDEGAGAQAADSSASANHGTVGGAAWAAGRFGAALSFDGDGDGVRIPTSPSLQPARITVEGWVRAEGTPGVFRHIVSQGANACTAATYGLYTGIAGGLAFYISNGTKFAVSPDAGTGVWDGDWHHVAGTFDGLAVHLYVDGVEVGTGTPTALAMKYALPEDDGSLGAYLGACPESHDYAGLLDEARVWRRALSATEIAASASMGASAATRLDLADDGDDDPVVYSTDYRDERITIGIESASGEQRITGVRIESVLPVALLVNCGSLLSKKCSVSLSNGGRTARLRLNGLLDPLLSVTVRLRVSLASGRSFAVTARD